MTKVKCRCGFRVAEETISRRLKLAMFKSLRRIFTTAVLLTANLGRAETAVWEGPVIILCALWSLRTRKTKRRPFFNRAVTARVTTKGGRYLNLTTGFNGEAMTNGELNGFRTILNGGIAELEQVFLVCDRAEFTEQAERAIENAPAAAFAKEAL
jgi:hypothetical protein